MTEYLFRFCPLQPWFFGGERGFRYGPDAVDDSGNLNYFVKSNLIPQQTTLLGAVKYILLKSQGIKVRTDWRYPDEEWEKISSIAGYGVINAEEEGDSRFFGAVEEISPLLLNRDDVYWLPVPADHLEEGETKYMRAKYKPMPYVCLDNKKAWGNFGSVGFLKGYSAEKGLFSGWMNVWTGETWRNDEIFVECTRVGIEIPEQLKKVTGQQEEKKFYKQTYISFRKQNPEVDQGACPEVAYDHNHRQDKGGLPDRFALFVKLKDGIKIDCKGGFANFEVMLGGRGGLFAVEVTEEKDLCYREIEQEYYTRVLEASGQPRIVLISDTLVSYEVLNHLAEYAVYETVDFRPFSVDISQAQSRAKTGKAVKSLGDRSSVAYRLLKRGAVIYPKEGVSGKELDNCVMQRLGYNRKIVIGGERGYA
ncbi:MAG TPA: hypothetical protein GXX39_00535 [Syntrophothermus lipocalidus]|nr:hypothetical protein [Syntrophothermus lipocalidus]